MLNQDFREMLSELSAQQAEFLLAGAYALADCVDGGLGDLGIRRGGRPQKH